MEGNTLTVVELHPPFDQPYVAKVGKEHYVWVRAGSSTTTASRYLLDEFYRRKASRPTLSLSWLDSNEELIVPLPVPPLPPVDIDAELQRLSSLRPTDAELANVDARREDLLKLLRDVGPEALGLGKTRAEPESIVTWPECLAADIDRALEVAHTDAEEFRRRFKLSLRGVAFKLEVLNQGSHPATNTVAFLRSRDKLRILSLQELYEADLAVGDAQAVRARRVVEIARSPERFERLHPPLAGVSLTGQDLSPLPPLGPPHQKAVEVDVEDGSLRIDINRQLKHNFREIIAPDFIYLAAFLEPGEIITLEYECHADELPNPSQGQLTVAAVSGDSIA